SEKEEIPLKKFMDKMNIKKRDMYAAILGDVAPPIRKARVDEGKSNTEKGKARAERNDRQHQLSMKMAPKKYIKEHHTRADNKAKVGNKDVKVVGRPAHRQEGVHTSPQGGGHS